MLFIFLTALCVLYCSVKCDCHKESGSPGQCTARQYSLFGVQSTVGEHKVQSSHNIDIVTKKSVDGGKTPASSLLQLP